METNIDKTDNADNEFELLDKLMKEHYDDDIMKMIPALAMFFTFLVRSLYNMKHPQAKVYAKKFITMMRKSLQLCERSWPTPKVAQEMQPASP